MMVSSKREAWEAANKIFPTDYELNEKLTCGTGYDIYTSTAEGNKSWISDLGNRLEVNVWNGKTVETTNVSVEMSVNKPLHMLCNTDKGTAVIVEEIYEQSAEDRFDDAVEAFRELGYSVKITTKEAVVIAFVCA